MAVKILIGVPCHGRMCVQTAMSLALAVKVTPHEMILSAECGPYIHWNRESLFDQAVDADCSHLMFIDTDMFFPHDGILKLLRLEKPIAGADYNTKDQERAMEGRPLSTSKFADDRGNLIDLPPTLVPRYEPHRRFAVATGFMLIDVRAASVLEKPRFRCDTKEFGGEDVYFCRRANEAGLEVWCDPTIRVGHIGDYIY